jgi:hypothetical protein
VFLARDVPETWIIGNDRVSLESHRGQLACIGCTGSAKAVAARGTILCAHRLHCLSAANITNPQLVHFRLLMVVELLVVEVSCQADGR